MTMKIATQRDELSKYWHAEMFTLEKKPSYGFRSMADYQAFCVAKDWIQDTAEVLMHHRKIGFSHDYLLSYLELYGILQAIFVQQDAIRTMRESFRLPEINFDLGNLPNGHALRELRNKLVGHPVKKRMKDSGIARYS
jgi:hypothetical protein